MDKSKHATLLSGIKICIVEDDAFFRKLLEKKLLNHGATVSPAENGEQALDLVSQFRFDLIILDLLLPGIDGFEFLRRRSTNIEASKIPVMILSNFSEPNQLKMAKDLGVKTYLVKAAVNMEMVIEEIRKILNK